MTINELKDVASQVRRDIIRMVHGCQSGHPGGSLGATDIVTALYFDQMQIDPKHFKMDGAGEDMFFLSNGHISPMLYSILARRGYFPVAELATFRRLGTRLQGHPTPVEGLPGIRMASGSLGQGLSVAIGAAQAKKLSGDNHLVFCLMGDGEQEEGQIWEAAMYAPAKNVDNLVAIIDYNKKQIDGSTDDVMSLGNLRAKYEAFGWKVYECDGNDMQEIVDNLNEARENAHQGFAQIILAHTEMGMGVDFMMGTHKWHGTPPNDEQAASALSQLKETLGDY
ncbi:MAG: transketolase [Bacteroidales bacterium]|nr:transketolase [Bacteroidales bacterium]MBR4138285.1 transketolase [Bacteroidales bacterium]